MADSVSFSQRLRKGLARIQTEAGGVWEGEVLELLRVSLLLTLANVESKTGARPARFRFQFTGGKALLFQGNEALPMEPEKLFRLLNAVDVELKPGETVDLDGRLAAWLIRPEVTLVDSTLRDAEENLRVLKSNRDRDHGATQAADSTRIRLRSRMTQLIAALQMAQKDPEGAVPPGVPLEVPPEPAPAVVEAPPPPPPPKPSRETAVRPAPTPPPPPPAEAKEPEPEPPPAPSGPSPLQIALRKIVSVIAGCGFKSAAIGDLAHLSWGSSNPVTRIELLLSIGQTQRESLLSFARGEGLFPAAGGGPLNLRYVDAKLGHTADVDLMEVTLPLHREAIARAKPDFVLGTEVRVASCEDLIVLRAASTTPGHRESVVELLRLCVNRIDASYLKRAAQTLGVLEQLKSVWQESKKPPPETSAT